VQKNRIVSQRCISILQTFRSQGALVTLVSIHQTPVLGVNLNGCDRLLHFQYTLYGMEIQLVADLQVEPKAVNGVKIVCDTVAIHCCNRLL